MLNGITTRSPGLMWVTSAPTSSTIPIGSWPSTSPASMNAPRHLVEVEVGAADRGRGDSHDRVGRLLDRRVGDGVDAHVVGSMPGDRLHRRARFRRRSGSFLRYPRFRLATHREAVTPTRPQPRSRTMADLTPLDEKLAEVLGLAQAAQTATARVATMEDAERFESQLERMRTRGGRDRAPHRRADRRPRRQEDRDPRHGARDQVRGRRDDENVPRRRGGGARRLRVPDDGGGRRARPLGDRPDDGGGDRRERGRASWPTGRSRCSADTSSSSDRPRWSWRATRSPRRPEPPDPP